MFIRWLLHYVKQPPSNIFLFFILSNTKSEPHRGPHDLVFDNIIKMGLLISGEIILFQPGEIEALDIKISGLESKLQVLLALGLNQFFSHSVYTFGG